MSAEQTEEVVAALAHALVDAELTADELTGAVVERTGSWAGDLVMPAFQGRWPRWRQVLALAGIRGALCFGPNRGRTVTYTSPRRWLPDFAPTDGPDALHELVRRYLSASGNIAITVEPLHVLRPGRLRELDRQVARVGDILEARAVLTIGPVTVGAHA